MIIKLTNNDKITFDITTLYVNTERIIYFYEDPKYNSTAICFDNRTDCVLVKESPEEINKLINS